jgi:outer membrane protein
LNLLRLVALLGVLAAPAAHAQYQNKGLGLTVGYLSLSGVQNDELNFGIPVGLTASLYIENGFGVVIHAGIMIVHDDVVNSNIIGLDGPSIGVRYFFLEESWKPYVGLDLSYLHLFGVANGITSDFFGLGPNAGVDYFISDSVSIGLRARFNLYLSLNAVWPSYGLNADVATYF